MIIERQTGEKKCEQSSVEGNQLQLSILASTISTNDEDSVKSNNIRNKKKLPFRESFIHLFVHLFLIIKNFWMIKFNFVYPPYIDRQTDIHWERNRKMGTFLIKRHMCKQSLTHLKREKKNQKQNVKLILFCASAYASKLIEKHFPPVCQQAEWIRGHNKTESKRQARGCVWKLD